MAIEIDIEVAIEIGIEIETERDRYREIHREGDRDIIYIERDTDVAIEMDMESFVNV